MMREPVDHILRSVLPWRPTDLALTECGLPAASYPTITREEHAARLEEWGQRRTMFTTCQTCDSTIGPTWAASPVQAMRRECARSGWYGEDSTLEKELRALEALVAAHPEEFAETIAGLAEVGDIAARRKQARLPRPTPPKPPNRGRRAKRPA